MILILSTPRDTDTQLVIDELYSKKAVFFRLNDEDLMEGRILLNLNPLKMQDSFLSQGNTKVYLKDVEVVWYRKFGFFKSYEEVLGKKSDITRYIYSEFSIIRRNIYKILEKKKWLFKRSNMLTKLEILEIANQCNLKIPNSVVTSEKKELDFFFKENNCLIISKSIGDGKHIEFKNKNYPFYTQLINSLSNVPFKFSPSLFQAYIEKEYELRIFFLDGEFYSMVIFSQNNEKTKIDFRNYDWEKPNRVGPYLLPKEIEGRLLNLMKTIGLNTGSIDMIRSTDGNYYFLEVNPSGQFGMTGIPCNYNLHEKVADYLIKQSK